MSSGEGGGGLHPDLKGLLFILLLVWLAWYFVGGKDRAKNTDKPFLYPAAPIDSGEAYGPTDTNVEKPTVHAW